MTASLVSVIVPVYNGARTLADSISSALNQSWNNLEIIIVDDGSADDSAVVAQRFVSQRVKLIRQTNGGAARARNVGLAASRGAYLQFLDCDDLLHARKIEAQLDRLQGEASDTVACGAWESFDRAPGDGKRARQHWTNGPPVDWLMQLRGGGGKMALGAWLTPRAVAERAGPWNENLSLDDDGEYFSRIVLAANAIVFCDESLYYYRRPTTHHLSWSRSDSAVGSLLAVQRIYEQRLIGAENSARAREAAAHGYASFLEQMFPDFPNHCAEAIRAIERLGVRHYPPPGSEKFGFLVQRFGLMRALAARERLRRLLGRPLLSRNPFGRLNIKPTGSQGNR